MPLPAFAVGLIIKTLLPVGIVLAGGVAMVAGASVPMNNAHYPVGEYGDYHYSAKVFEHKPSNGIGNTRVEQIKVTKNGEVVMDYNGKRWVVRNTEPKLDNIVRDLNKQMAKAHPELSIYDF